MWFKIAGVLYKRKLTRLLFSRITQPPALYIQDELSGTAQNPLCIESGSELQLPDTGLRPLVAHINHCTVYVFVCVCMHSLVCLSAYLTIPPFTPPSFSPSLLSEVSSSSVTPLDSSACKEGGIWGANKTKQYYC